MIQDQLVDYISSQRALGVSRDAIKAALVGAGWVPADVDDTFKKVEGGAAVSPGAGQTVKPTSVSSPSVAAAAKPAVKSADVQTIRVSDLVSASVSSSSPVVSGVNSVNVTKGSPAKNSPAMTTAKPSSFISPGKNVVSSGQKSGKGVLMGTIAIVVIVLLAALSVYLFLQNESLGKSVGGVSAQSADVTSQIAALQAQVQGLTASGTALTAQVATLNAANQDLATNLSFFVVPPADSGAPVAATAITVSGVVSSGKPIYSLVTSDGVRVYVKNSSDAGVKAALQPFVGSSTTVQISGTYMPGSPNITVNAVNGTPTTAPAATTGSPMIPATTSSTASTTGQ